MKIEYRKQTDNEQEPWQLLTNIDELIWNGVYALRVSDDDGSLNFPFRFGNDDTVTLVVKDHSHAGRLDEGRTIVQTITYVDSTTGNVFAYTRACYNAANTYHWNYWSLATEGEAVIDIPKATNASLGGVIIGDGLTVDADGKVSLAVNSIGEENLTPTLNAKLSDAMDAAHLTGLFTFNSSLPLKYGALLKNESPYHGTNLRVYTPRILANGEQLLLGAGYLISACKIFNGDTETSFTKDLNTNLYSLDAKGFYYQFEFKKSDQTAFSDEELSQVVKYYQPNHPVWTKDSHIDRFITPGSYYISGQHTSEADGLPIADVALGRTFHARLQVLDSSATGTGYANDKCITQILALGNSASGDIYVRTGRAASEGELACGNGWNAWGKLQQNVGVGQVTSLNTFVENGIYSGTYINGSAPIESFVMVVINNYAVATATGTVRNVSQLKYAVDVNGAFSYKVRTGQGTNSVEWGEWSDLDTVTTARIHDGAVTATKLSADVRENVEKVPRLEQNSAKEKTALVNGDTIVGLAREVYSRQGKTDTSTFLKRTTAGGTSISDGVATLKQIGGNIVKNVVSDSINAVHVKTEFISNLYYLTSNSGTNASSSYLTVATSVLVDSHKYYVNLYVNTNNDVSILWGTSNFSSAVERTVIKKSGNRWYDISSLVTLKNKESDSLVIFPFGTSGVLSGEEVALLSPILMVDLTEMFGAGNEPTKEECDRMFACMGTLPQGLTVANPTAFVSTGYNQFNPANVINSKDIAENNIISGDKHIAVIECLPCKVGTGENNGYVIGYGEGDGWSDEGIEVYLSPLNPITTDGELYMHKLSKDDTTNTYVPQIKGYLFVVTPTTDKLCAHLLWSGDRDSRDYEPFVESVVSLPDIPQMSEWGLAGIAWNKEYIQDTIDLEKNEYCKRVFILNFKDRTWYNNGNLFYADFGDVGVRNMIICNGYARTTYNMAYLPDDKTIMYSGQYVYIHDLSFSGNITGFRDYIKDKFAYIAVNAKETYPIVTKAAPNYIGSDYGVEEFAGSKVPLAANILFYMRSLVSETRNFLDRLMAGLGVSDATAAADKIISSVMPSVAPESE